MSTCLSVCLSVCKAGQVIEYVAGKQREYQFRHRFHLAVIGQGLSVSVVHFLCIHFVFCQIYVNCSIKRYLIADSDNHVKFIVLPKKCIIPQLEYQGKAVQRNNTLLTVSNVFQFSFLNFQFQLLLPCCTHKKK